MQIKNQLKISKEYFSNNDFQDIIYNYFIKMFTISNNDFDLF